MDARLRKPDTAANFLLGLGGAMAGGALGYVVFLWVARQGFYMLALPGALLGFGGGLLIHHRSWAFAGLCGFLALALGVLAEWRGFPFLADDSLSYFLTHLHQLRTLTLIMILLGGSFGFYFALGGQSKHR